MKENTTIVYRFLTIDELNHWIKNEKNQISKPYKKDNLSNPNTHKYIEGAKYVHFFKNLNDAQNVLRILDQSTNILCKFEIPENILSTYEGIGTYFDENLDKTQIIEYAIPLVLISSSYLKEYKEINSLDEAKFVNDKIGWNKVLKENNFEM